MSSFFLDVWYDLASKRLLPVAVALALALIAVPIFLVQSAPDEPPAMTSAQAPARAASPIRLRTTAEWRSSDLSKYSERDPFGQGPTSSAGGGRGGKSADSAPLAELGKAVGAAGDLSSSTLQAPESFSGSGGAPGGAGSGASPTSSGSGSGEGSETGENPSAGGDSPADGSEPSGGDRPAALYRYTVDLRFGQGESVQDYKKVVRFRMLPSEDNPLVVFLGATDDGTEGVFLLDAGAIPTLDGQGRCEPSPEKCSFLFLRPGEQVSLSSAGDPGTEGDPGAGAASYSLGLVDITLAKVPRKSTAPQAEPLESRGLRAGRQDEPTNASEPDPFGFPDFGSLLRPLARR